MNTLGRRHDRSSETITLQRFPVFTGDKRIQNYAIILHIFRVSPDSGLSGPKYVVIEIIGTFVRVTRNTLHLFLKAFVPPYLFPNCY
jgi:hypothetical protein